MPVSRPRTQLLPSGFLRQPPRPQAISLRQRRQILIILSLSSIFSTSRHGSSISHFFKGIIQPLHHIAISPVCGAESCSQGLKRFDRPPPPGGLSPVCHFRVTDGSKMTWWHWVLRSMSVSQDTGCSHAMWLMAEPDANKSHSFLLGQPDCEETSCQPPWSQSDERK